jgi:hypothetical protein
VQWPSTGDDWVSHLLLGDRAHKGVWHGVVLHSLIARSRLFCIRQDHADKLEQIRHHS